jgi:hypothetical protein
MWATRSFVVTLLLVACQREKPQPIKATPVAPVVPASATGNATCDDYLRRVAACTKLTPQLRDTLARGGGIWKHAVDQQGTPAHAASESCAGAAAVAGPTLSELGC